MVYFRLLDLPNEIIAHILGFLISPEPAEDRLRRDPEQQYREKPWRRKTNADVSLKSVSLVCHKLRDCALPILFQTAVWAFARFHKPPGDVASRIDVLDFLRRNQLSPYVQHFIVLIRPPHNSGTEWNSGGQFWGILPPMSELHYLPKVMHLDEMERWLNWEDRHSGNEPERFWKFLCNFDHNWIWHAIFAQLDPLRISLIAPKGLLAALFGRCTEARFHKDKAYSDTLSQRDRLHVISLSRNHRDADASSNLKRELTHLANGSDSSYIPINLFTLRPWTCLFIHDNSCYRARFCSSNTSWDDSRDEHFVVPLLLAPKDPAMRQLFCQIQTLSLVNTLNPNTALIEMLFYTPPVENLDIQISSAETSTEFLANPKAELPRTWPPRGWPPPKQWERFSKVVKFRRGPRYVKRLRFVDAATQYLWDAFKEEFGPRWEGLWETPSIGTFTRDEAASSIAETRRRDPQHEWQDFDVDYGVNPGVVFE